MPPFEVDAPIGISFTNQLSNVRAVQVCAAESAAEMRDKPRHFSFLPHGLDNLKQNYPSKLVSSHLIKDLTSRIPPGGLGIRHSTWFSDLNSMDSGEFSCGMRTERTEDQTYEMIQALDGAKGEAVVSKATVTHNFQFIDLSTTSEDQKKRNRTIARSHAMKIVRRGQQRLTQSPRRISNRLSMPGEEEKVVEEEIETVTSSSGSRTPDWQDIYSAAFAATMAKGFNSTIISPTHRVMLEHDIGPLQTYSGRVTPALHECIEFFTRTLWPAFLPAATSTELSPLAMDWFSMIRTSPALFHSSISFAGPYVEAKDPTKLLTHSPEMIAHDVEAIRQINLELGRNNLSDDVLLAIMTMSKCPEITNLEMKKRIELNSTSPFGLPSMPPPWHENFIQVRIDDAHTTGARIVMGLKGGISGLKSLCAAKSISYNDLREAALNLRKPYYDFYDLPAVRLLAEDALYNVLPAPIEDFRGSGFPALLGLGLTEEALMVVLDMVKLSAVMEAYCQHTLINPNLLGLISRRNEIHHRLLSLPSGVTLEESSGRSYRLYECCRLAALAYATAALFTLPLSAGSPRRLVLQLQSAMEGIPLEGLHGRGGKFYIWVLFLAGIWAEKMPERPWFIDRLRRLLELEGVYRWRGLKSVLTSFLWMSAICDEGAMNLWEDVVSEIRKP